MIPALQQELEAYSVSRPILPRQGARRLAFIYEGVAYGGTEEYILLMLQYLDRTRYTPIVIIPGYMRNLCPVEFIEKVDAQKVPIVYTNDHGLSRIGGIVRNLNNLVKIFKETETDVIHIHNQRPDGGKRATFMARLAGVRAIVRSEHLPPSSNLQFHSRYSIKPHDWLTDYIIAGSDSCLVEHFDLLGRDPVKTLRIYYGIELERFDPKHDVQAAKMGLGLDPRIPTIGKIARLSLEKGHTYLIDAAAIVLREFGPVNFLLVGDGPLEEDLRAQVARHGIQDHVHFLGFAPDTVPYLKAMDITTMSSISEGISLSMLEYMAMGKPVVSTNEPSFAETIVDGESGIIVELENPESLAAGLLKVLCDPQLSCRLGRAAYQRVHQEFDIRINVNKIMQLYDKLLDT